MESVAEKGRKLTDKRIRELENKIAAIPGVENIGMASAGSSLKMLRDNLEINRILNNFFRLCK